MKFFVFSLIAFPAMFVLTTVPGAFALMLTWNWFLVPLGVGELTYWHAIGIDTLATMLNILPIVPSAKKLNAEEAWDFITNRIKLCWINTVTVIITGALANYMMRVVTP